MTRPTMIIESNILDFDGLLSGEIFKEIDVNEGDEFNINAQLSIDVECRLSQNRNYINLLNDFDVIKFLNENDIGTDATRAPILSELINLRYLFSESVLLTTFLGNAMNNLANQYVGFIDIDYTLDIEKKLNQIENGKMNAGEFEAFVKKLIVNTHARMQLARDEIKKLFLDVPRCEMHGIPMIIKAGKFGRFLACPRSLTSEKCSQRVSI
jgi:hypothetical protein